MNITVNLEYEPHVPLFRRLSDALRKAILDGRLQLGEPMPSVRDLSATLKISRATILKALEDLQRQGLIQTRSGSGTTVCKELPGDLVLEEPRSAESPGAEVEPAHLTEMGTRLERMFERGEICTVHEPANLYGGAPLELTPLKSWKKVLMHSCRLSDLNQANAELDPEGFRPLREALSEYLHRSRAVVSNIDQLILFGSKQCRLDLICRILIDSGDGIAFEEPGYVESRTVFEAHGAEILPVAVDEQGISIAALNALPAVKLVYVTPSHQDPTGVEMSVDRRRQLLNWAKERNVIIIEDDYDCEFRYGKKALPSLQGMDGGKRVIYMSSMWKVFQAIRLAYIVMPEQLVHVARLAKLHIERHVPLVEQLALTEFVNEGHLELHIKKTQTKYAKQRQSLIFAVTKHLSGVCKIVGAGGGTHLLLHFDPAIDEQTVLRAAREAGVPLLSTREYYYREPRSNEFAACFADLAQSDVSGTVRAFAASLRGEHAAR